LLARSRPAEWPSCPGSGQIGPEGGIWHGVDEVGPNATWRDDRDAQLIAGLQAAGQVVVSLGGCETIVAKVRSRDANVVRIMDGYRCCNNVAKQMRIDRPTECLLGAVN
jgi:hypothetical protein